MNFGDTCNKLWISYEKQDGRCHHRTIERETAVAMIDQLSTYIYVHVDNYQNKICIF